MIALGTDRFEFLGKLLVGQDTGVLELTKAIVGEDGKVLIRNDGTDGFLADIGNETMLPEMDTEEVIDTVVDGDAVEMVDLMV